MRTLIICLCNFFIAIGAGVMLEYLPAARPLHDWLCMQPAWIALPIFVGLYVPALVAVIAEYRKWYRKGTKK